MEGYSPGAAQEHLRSPHHVELDPHQDNICPRTCCRMVVLVLAMDLPLQHDAVFMNLVVNPLVKYQCHPVVYLFFLLTALLGSCVKHIVKKRIIILKTVDCRLSEKKIKNTQKLNRTLFTQTEQDRVTVFKGILFCNATNNTITNKSLSCCQLGASRRMCVRPSRISHTYF